MTRGRFAVLLLAMLLAAIGVDIVLHAGFLHRFYLQPDPFLLPPKRAFQLIPLGYTAFVIILGYMLWLMARLKVAGASSGFSFALVFGAAFWGAGVLGLLSISTANPWLMLGWFLGQTIETGIAGAFAGAGLAGMRSSRLLLRAAGLMLFCFVTIVVLQSTGIVPTIKME
jgi:hypothetical protein